MGASEVRPSLMAECDCALSAVALFARAAAAAAPGPVVVAFTPDSMLLSKLGGRVCRWAQLISESPLTRFLILPSKIQKQQLTH